MTPDDNTVTGSESRTVTYGARITCSTHRTHRASDIERNAPRRKNRFAQRVPFRTIANWGAHREGAAVYDAVLDAMASLKTGQVNGTLTRALRGLELDGAVHTIRTINTLWRLSLDASDLALLDVAMCRTYMSIASTGMQFTSQTADLIKFPSTVTGFPGAFSHGLSSAIDALDEVPVRPLPTTVVQAGR